MFQEVLERAKGLALALIQKSTQTNKQTRACENGPVLPFCLWHWDNATTVTGED